MRSARCGVSGVALVLLGVIVLGGLSQAATDPIPVPVSALTADELADKVQATYQGFSDLQGIFLQRATNKLSGMTQEASGRLFLKWPGRMRWEYEKPESRLFLIDGKILWSYSPSERQAMKQDMSGALTTGPIGILFGMSSLRRDFQVRPIVHAGTRDSPESLLELTPKGKGLSFKRVILGVDRESFFIQRLTVFDLYGNTTEIELSKQKVNSGLKDELFQFSPPPGTDIVAPLKPLVP
ncbi:outer membrane lipoprotein chaperone LolA [Candidatus Methylomirabilis sp.]|uniref:outer membrane lipoprotein chaperone LolA n=1 Tax=Candidatus Methylomirabilis sp. TaxID=2032687 RepID=UPI002A5B627A|nr:outer membrane lipoprotein chaperone LolA [Candidatus Methylomirabilis sp.]